MYTVLLIFVISLAFSQVNCGPIKIKNTQSKRAVFDILPSAKMSERESRPGSFCECLDGSLSCIRDEHLVCRMTLASLPQLDREENLQIVDRIERRIRRKSRRNLKKLFRKWLKEEVGREKQTKKH